MFDGGGRLYGITRAPEIGARAILASEKSAVLGMRRSILMNNTPVSMML
jgi:hypothetical protein